MELLPECDAKFKHLLSCELAFLSNALTCLRSENRDEQRSKLLHQAKKHLDRCSSLRSKLVNLDTSHKDISDCDEQLLIFDLELLSHHKNFARFHDQLNEILRKSHIKHGLLYSIGELVIDLQFPVTHLGVILKVKANLNSKQNQRLFWTAF